MQQGLLFSKQVWLFLDPVKNLGQKQKLIISLSGKLSPQSLQCGAHCFFVSSMGQGPGSLYYFTLKERVNELRPTTQHHPLAAPQPFQPDPPATQCCQPGPLHSQLGFDQRLTRHPEVRNSALGPLLSDPVQGGFTKSSPF